MAWTEAGLRKLYVNEKKSAAYIARISKCSIHKVNYWLERYAIPKRSIAEAIYVKRNPDGDPFCVRAPRTMEDAKLFGLGLGLYWGAGNKKNKTAIRLGNVDPGTIRTFIEFLTRLFGADVRKMRFGLQVFSDVSKEKALQFWIYELKSFDITKDQFFKVIVTPSHAPGTYRQKSRFGVLTIYFCNSKLKKILDSLIENMPM